MSKLYFVKQTNSLLLTLSDVFFDKTGELQGGVRVLVLLVLGVKCLQRFQQGVGRGRPSSLLAELELRSGRVVGDGGERGGVLGTKQGQVFGEGRSARVQLHKSSHWARGSV